MDDVINTFCFPKLLTTFRETPSFLKYLCMHPSSGAYLGSDCGYSSLSSDPDSFRSFSQLFRGDLKVFTIQSFQFTNRKKILNLLLWERPATLQWKLSFTTCISFFHQEDKKLQLQRWRHSSMSQSLVMMWLWAVRRHSTSLH